MYTASDAFFDALWELGIRYCFVNLGSDHPSIIEAIVKGQRDRPETFPKIITCPNEMVALSMADGYARVTNEPQCVIVHVDVGTQGLGAAVHNASTGRAPVLIFAGLSPYSLDGELTGSRTEYIHWIQDVPDQKQIVSQYCRYTGEIRRGVNVKQMVGRAYQFAMSAPRGPVYLVGSREAMEEEIPVPSPMIKSHWEAVHDAALSSAAVQTLVDAFVKAESPLIITGYVGRNHEAVGQLVKFADAIPGLRVLDTAGSDMCFPSSHAGSLGLRYGVDASITEADLILVLDCDVPWVPTLCRPKPTTRIFHIDSDPLKQQMPVFYLATEARWKADASLALSQLLEYISTTPGIQKTLAESEYQARAKDVQIAHQSRTEAQQRPTRSIGERSESFTTAELSAFLRLSVPALTIFAVEAVTSTLSVADHIRPTEPGTWLNCGGGGLGWSGGAALGIKLALEHMGCKDRMVVQIVGDGTFLFSVPGSVYWIGQRYNLPVLTIVLNNKGWNAPKRSLLLVHPNGEGSRATNEQMGISFAPVSPDYAGLAKAAAGGENSGVWTGKVDRLDDMKEKLVEAITWVKEKRGSAVLDAVVCG